MANLKNTVISDAQFRLPIGSSSDRPSPFTESSIRYNTELNRVEHYIEGSWVSSDDQSVFAIGGEIYHETINGKNYRIHIFKNVGSDQLEVQRGGLVEFLIVAGGGSGGKPYGGGGGAGGVITGSTEVTQQTYAITVGAGGNSRDASTGTSESGENGGDSAAFGLTAIGGGGGGAWNGNNPITPGNGGSGGGGGCFNSIESFVDGGSGTAGQGNTGGRGYEYNNGGGGGGGGAGHQGSDTTPGGPPGIGGTGLKSFLTGQSLFYAAGGGGGDRSQSSSGGFGGGGSGASGTDPAGSGAFGTGSGGGGSGGTGQGSNADTMGDSGAGGSGIVIVRYELVNSKKTQTATTKDNGLILNIDFSSTHVYDGYGSQISDTKNKDRGNLVNSPTFTHLGTSQGVINFTGSEYITYPMETVRPTNQLTLETFIKFNTAGATQVIIGSQRGTGSSNSYALWVTSSNEWNGGVETSDGTGFTLTRTATRATDVWYHFVFTYDGSQEILYLDNSVLGSRNKTGSIIYNQTNRLLALGADWNGSGYDSGITSFTDGQVSLIRIYDRALTADEIENNYNSFTNKFGI